MHILKIPEKGWFLPILENEEKYAL
jgi:hypothetical protein